MEQEKDEFGTFYKIKLLYTNDIIISNYKTTQFEKQIEYHLSNKNNKYLYYKFIDNKLEFMTNEYRSNHMVKNIYHILKNIEKLKEGKIKNYRIFTQLELEILCDYLKKNNIEHAIKITGKMGWPIHYRNIRYNSIIFKENFDRFKTYFNHYDSNYEKNKINNTYELYIQVYKGFVDLMKYSGIEKPKYGIYLYPEVPNMQISNSQNELMHHHP